MSITTTFDPPQPSDSPSVFNAKAFSTLGDLNTWSGEANALAEAVNADADTATAKASEASSFASEALASKNSSSNSAGVATSKAGEAADAASDAIAAKNAAELAASHVSGVNTGDQTALTTPNTPAGSLAATNVQAAINELDTKKAPLASPAFTGYVAIGGVASAMAKLLVTQDSDLTLGTNYAHYIAGNGYAGGIALDATSMQIGQNSSTRSLTLHSGTGYAERVNISGAGVILIKNSPGLGYGAGSGGTATQATSKTTPVTLNKACGQITMHNAALAAGTSVFFQVNNTLVTGTDSITVTTVDDFGDYYIAVAFSVWASYFYIRVTNITAGSLSQAVRVNFQVHKGSAS